MKNISWKRNLIVLWITQFLSSCGFALSLPFTPFFLRECIGVAPEQKIQIYAALAATLSSVSLAILAPIWGTLSDRFGRKSMVIRATWGGGIILFSIGFTHTISAFLTLRFMQGIFTGVMGACMTLAIINTPKERAGFVLGAMSSACFSGEMGGLFLGGLMATTLGYRCTFKLAGIILFASGFLVLFGAQECFVRPKAVVHSKARSFYPKETWIKLYPILGILLITTVTNAARMLDYSQFPLYIEMLNGGPGIPGAAKWTSWVLCMGSIGAMLSGVILGKLADKNSKRVAFFSIISAILFVLGIAIIPWFLQDIPRHIIHFSSGDFSFMTSILAVMPLRFGYIFFITGLGPIWNMWLARMTPKEEQGAMFGWATTFRSVGAICGHLLAGTIVCIIGIRALFFASALILLCLIPMVRRQFHHVKARMREIDA